MSPFFNPPPWGVGGALLSGGQFQQMAMVVVLMFKDASVPLNIINIDMFLIPNLFKRTRGNLVNMKG